MQTIRTQDIEEMENRAAFYALDPDYVTQPEGRIELSRPAVIGLTILRAYLIGVIGFAIYRFAHYAHWVR